MKQLVYGSICKLVYTESPGTVPEDIVGIKVKIIDHHRTYKNIYVVEIINKGLINDNNRVYFHTDSGRSKENIYRHVNVDGLLVLDRTKKLNRILE